MSIDPITVREELARIKKQQADLRRRSDGGLALAWLSDHALSKSGGPRVPMVGGVLQERLTVVATATPDADKVAPYVQRAYLEAQRGIILRAIELARADYESGREDAES